MRTRYAIALSIVLLASSFRVAAAEHPSLAKARALYNAGDHDGAISAAAMARQDPASADAAALVSARSFLERYRLRTSDAADLAAAREALAGIRAAGLKPRDQIDLLIGMGQALFLANSFGAAAELFDSALSRAATLPDRDRLLLLDWWASAVDRDAQSMPHERRAAAFQRVIERSEEELRENPGNAAANYWLAVSTRGAGDPERAWHAAVAAWVRAPLAPDTAAALRRDIDRFVTTVLIPERARRRSPREHDEALNALRAEWESTKADWK